MLTSGSSACKRKVTIPRGGARRQPSASSSSTTIPQSSIRDRRLTAADVRGLACLVAEHGMRAGAVSGGSAAGAAAGRSPRSGRRLLGRLAAAGYLSDGTLHRSRLYVRVPVQALRLSGAALRLWGALRLVRASADERRRAWLQVGVRSRRALAGQVGVSVRTVDRALVELRRAGLLRRRCRFRRGRGQVANGWELRLRAPMSAPSRGQECQGGAAKIVRGQESVNMSMNNSGGAALSQFLRESGAGGGLLEAILRRRRGAA